MDRIDILPDRIISDHGPISTEFLGLQINSFQQACHYVHQMPYGYNADRDDLKIIFEEKMGTCTTKHAVIATLAVELGLPVEKIIGIYAMTETLVTGTDAILETYRLPFLPMVHCFLSFEKFKVDLTEGNNNGKNQSIEDFLYTRQVRPNISAKDEYRLYRKAVQDLLTTHSALKEVDIKTILHAREDGLKLLRSKITLKGAGKR